jgi:cellulose synthase/poly-beta-1,6-N-acetylglucosamine synthase-like glycosyltransferase
LVAVTLYAVALGVVTLFGLNQFWLAWRFASTRSSIQGAIPEPDEALAPLKDPPRVTVQIPLYNEAFVADRVVAACARLDYPRDLMEVQVLDDSVDETVSVVANAVRYWRSQGLDIVHLRRTRRRGYKAGALAEGLRVARGEFVAMFDADFVPPRGFLLRMLPSFRDPTVGFVQARWGHLNDDTSTLTRLQGFGLDAHFAVEQTARIAAGYPAGFNGTAGIWRRACIEDAGGWSSDTLTEDLDLSYRAQLRGWKMAYLPRIVVPAEVPVETSGFRAQQHRWTKGAIQTAGKLLGEVVRSPQPRAFRVQGTAHLLANFGFPFMLALTLLHAPIGYLRAVGLGPGEQYYALLGLGVTGFGGFFGLHLLAQRALYPDWGRRLWRFPLFLAASTGMALANTLAVFEAVARRVSPFVRTPKFNSLDGSEAAAWWRTSYASAGIKGLAVAELVLAVYLAVGLAALVAAGAWASVPFQLVFVSGNWLLVGLSVRDARLANQSRVDERSSPGRSLQY